MVADRAFHIWKAIRQCVPNKSTSCILSDRTQTKANIEIFTEMLSIEDSLSETESSQFGSEDEKIEIEGTDGASNRFEDDSLEPYADEPLADEEWLENYRR